MHFDVGVEALNGNRATERGSYMNQYKHGKDTISAVSVEVFNYLSGVDKSGEVV